MSRSQQLMNSPDNEELFLIELESPDVSKLDHVSREENPKKGLNNKSHFVENIQASSLTPAGQTQIFTKKPFPENQELALDTTIYENNPKDPLIEKTKLANDISNFTRTKRYQRFFILFGMAAILVVVLVLLTLFSSAEESSNFWPKEDKFSLNIEAMNCKIIFEENKEGKNSIAYSYQLNYLLNYFSQVKPKIQKNDQMANITIKSNKLLWRTCLLKFSIPQNLTLTELNINCGNSECILVSTHPNIIIQKGVLEGDDHLDLNIRSITIKETLLFNSSFGTFQLNEFKVEDKASITVALVVGDVILQSSSDISINWDNPTFAYCFAGPFVEESSVKECTHIYKNNITNATENRTGVCSGTANICRSEKCSAPSSISVRQSSGNTYVKLLPATGIDVSYNPTLKIAKGTPDNYSLPLEDHFEKEIRKSYNESIKDRDPILIINLGKRHLQQQSYEKWVIASNPSFAYLRPWWLAVFSIDLLTARTLDYTGMISPGICPYHFSGSLEDFARVQTSLKEYFKLGRAEYAFVQPMNMKMPGFEYQNGTGVAEFYNDKPVSEEWIRVDQTTEGVFLLQKIDITSHQFILPTLILSFIGAALIGIVITRLFMVAIVMAHKKIIKIAQHTQEYKKNAVDLKASEGEKAIKGLEEVEPEPERVKINIGSILQESSFVSFMKTVPRVSAFVGFCSYTLIKMYVLNSVEDFCSVIFLEKEKEDIEKIRKNASEHKKLEMKEIKLKSSYEKFCFLNHYPELSLSENVQVFNSYGYNLVPDKEALAFSFLVEKRTVNLPPIEELQMKREYEIFDSIFNGIYEKSQVETDTIFMDEIENNFNLYCEKYSLQRDFSLNYDEFVKRNGLKKIYKGSLKLVYSESLRRTDRWYVLLLVCLVNMFYKLLSCLKLGDYHLATRKQSYYVLDEETLQEQFNFLSEKDLNANSSSFLVESRTRAIKKTLFYPLSFVHEIFFVLFHFLVTACLVLPFIFMALIYEINYEPYSTVSQEQLISLKDFLWAPLELPYRLPAFIEWNIVIISLMIIFSFMNILDDITYFFDLTFPEDKKILQFQKEMDYENNTLSEPKASPSSSTSRIYNCKLFFWRNFTWIRRKAINFYWIFVFFIVFCYSSYVGLVLLWLLLGAIINPNNF